MPVAHLAWLLDHPLLVAVLLREPANLHFGESSKSRLTLRPAQYVLTPEGIDYLREYLNIPAEVRPPPTLRVRTDQRQAD